jgi:5'-3' exonuclease
VRLHVVDGTYELFRAHFSKRPGHSKNGFDLKATTGLVESLLFLLHQEAESVTYVAVAFDNPIRSFRNDLFAAYKSDEGVPSELRAQFDVAEAATRALGVVVWSMDRYEADDAMATAAAKWSNAVEQVRLMSPDKDLFQCISGEKVVLVDRMRNKTTDESTLLQVRGLTPPSVPDYLALVGDTADGIPGLLGFGAKTAVLLLQRFLHLENIPSDVSKWPPGIRGAETLARTLQENASEVRLYRRLATLIADVPLEQNLEDLRWRGVPKTKFAEWCNRAEFPAPLTRNLKWNS